MIAHAIVLLTALLPVFSAAAEPDPQLAVLDLPIPPPEVSAAMAAIDRDWALPRFIRHDVRQDCAAPGYPFLLSGDFDGDRLPDHVFWSFVRNGATRAAVLYVRESSTDKLIALDRDETFDERYLPPLSINPRDTTVYDFNRGDSVKLKLDAPGVVYCWKAARAWMRERDGRYQMLQTSD